MANSLPDEIVDIIDEHDNVIGREKRSLVHHRGLPHRIAAILVQRSDGKYLIPTASIKKPEHGLLYHSAAGHVLTGETHVVAAVRELAEETGIAVSVEMLVPLGGFWLHPSDAASFGENARFEVFGLGYRAAMGKVLLNGEQVKARWLGKDDLLELYRKAPHKLSLPLSMTCHTILRSDIKCSPLTRPKAPPWNLH